MPEEHGAPEECINYAPETCGLCQGTGKVFTDICSACRGQGSVLVAQPAMKCALCQGTGKVFTDVCSACRGAGWANAILK